MSSRTSVRMAGSRSTRAGTRPSSSERFAGSFTCTCLPQIARTCAAGSHLAQRSSILYVCDNCGYEELLLTVQIKRPGAGQHQDMDSIRAGSGGSSAHAGWAGRIGGRSDRYLRHRENTENFPVALRVLPRDVRPHLEAVYDVARVIDDLGDEAPGDRTELLHAFRNDLDAIWTIGREP